MLHVPTGANAFGLTAPSWGTTRPAAAMGTSVTPGTGGYGSYTSLGTLSDDAYGLLIQINSNYVKAIARNTTLTIGVDVAGGTSYVEYIPHLICGSADNYIATGKAGTGVWYYFPMFVPGGSQIAAKGYSSVATAFRVAYIVQQKPPNPSMIRKGSFVETIGTSGLTGTTIVPGTTSEGSWTSIGTTTNRLWWWQIGFAVIAPDLAVNIDAVHVDLAVGTAGTKDVIITDLEVNISSDEASANPPLTAGVEWDVPAGSSLYMRAQASGTLDTYNCAAYGLGG